MINDRKGLFYSRVFFKLGKKGKLKSLSELSVLAELFRRKGQTVVLANGCFDLLHLGHLRYLEASRRLGDVLIVAVNNNASSRHIKGSGRPLMDEKERAALISGFACVDYVTLFREATVEKIIRAIKPDIHTKGTDYTVKTVPEGKIIREFGGRVAIVGGRKSRSTTGLLQRIKKIRQK